MKTFGPECYFFILECGTTEFDGDFIQNISLKLWKERRLTTTFFWLLKGFLSTKLFCYPVFKKDKVLLNLGQS